MSKLVLTRQQSREVDALAVDRYGIPSMVLMENAGRGAADKLLTIDPALTSHGSHPIAIFCGKGNNAGDGFVMARHLQICGANPRILLLAPPEQLRGDTQQNYKILRHTDVPLVDLSAQQNLTAALNREVSGSTWLIDALLGTGVTGALREPLHTAIVWMNAQAVNRLAVDVPSGLDCDTGQPAAATVRADHTCTFVAPKIGFSVPTAAQYVGELHVVSIGIPPSLIDKV